MPPARRTAFTERNLLLGALPKSEYQALLPSLQSISLARGAVLFEVGAPITHVYFPQRCVVSLLTPGDAQSSGEAGVEVALVGNEGMAGIAVFLGAKSSLLQAVLQVPDHAWRMKVAAFRRAVAASAALRGIMQRYTQTVLSQIAQSVMCSQRHDVDARCARWLLMAHDRVGSDEFLLTQEFLGQMVGARRPTVSQAASRLQALGVIRYTRGNLTVLDRERLEAGSCSCYATGKAAYKLAFA